jgi:hypothetical protein
VSINKKGYSYNGVDVMAHIQVDRERPMMQQLHATRLPRLQPSLKLFRIDYSQLIVLPIVLQLGNILFS